MTKATVSQFLPRVRSFGASLHIVRQPGFSSFWAPTPAARNSPGTSAAVPGHVAWTRGDHSAARGQIGVSRRYGGCGATPLSVVLSKAQHVSCPHAPEEVLHGGLHLYLLRLEEEYKASMKWKVWLTRKIPQALPP